MARNFGITPPPEPSATEAHEFTRRCWSIGATILFLSIAACGMSAWLTK